MTYPDAIKFLYDLRLFGAKFGLENTFTLAALAGNPHNKLRFIHVAGTNGKGSTCAMLESVYRNAGLRVGLFTSPHLVSFRERIQVNRQLISESDVARLVEELRALQNPAGETPPIGRRDACPTFFEFVTVLALAYFAEQKCDLVVWETGLGGRLDATNIVTPLASLITNIAFDHQQWLGDTLEAIAAEKAGIIKPGVPILTATDAPEALHVIERIASEQGAPLSRIEPLHASRFTQDASLRGDHQKINAALALAAVAALQPQIPVAQGTIRAGLAAVNWPGRLQVVQRPDGQTILLDGAHNPAGAAVLRAALEKDFAGVRPLIIFGALADKKWREICDILAPLADQVITVPVASDRTAAAADLAATFRSARPGLEAAAAPGLEDALKACKHRRFVVITGSLYLVGEALERLGYSPAGAGERGLNEWSGPQNPAIRQG
jgi:dihydrofolate synthase/folylpolyglutamate synthase